MRKGFDFFGINFHVSSSGVFPPLTRWDSRVYDFWWAHDVRLYCVEQKIYANKVNKNAYKALIAAEYVGVKVETTPDLDFATIKSPEFIKMNPMGKVLYLVCRYC